MPPAVVIPTFNEADNIGLLVSAIRVHLPDAHILVVDDASPDGTADRAEAAGVAVIRRVGPRGLGPAYREGFTRVLAEGWDPILQMDADLSHDPADLPRLVAALAEADLALGSRWTAGGGTVAWGLGRRMLSRFGSAYARTWLKMPQRDLTGGFKAWRAATLEAVGPQSLHADGYAFQIESTWRAHRFGARIVEVPIVFTERRAGVSKLSGRIVVEAAWRVPGLS
ncbi:MAG: polyprenol monophosphomannose synthase [Pseudomonadota bacterium]|nr:polyprenol monophosphomannose synthase [Pseudomonadota bacterium]